MDQTALHIAVHQGHTRIVERLVGFGINLNVQDATGDTALHTALSKTSVDMLSAETPQLKKV
jgi:E3 ubiquitin-protein ligase mind-bomb